MKQLISTSITKIDTKSIYLTVILSEDGTEVKVGTGAQVLDYIRYLFDLDDKYVLGLEKEGIDWKDLAEVLVEENYPGIGVYLYNQPD
jgi:hypothetical protein